MSSARPRARSQRPDPGRAFRLLALLRLLGPAKCPVCTKRAALTVGLTMSDDGIAPHRAPPIVYRLGQNKAGKEKLRIRLIHTVARSPRFLSPSTVPCDRLRRDRHPSTIPASRRASRRPRPTTTTATASRRGQATDSGRHHVIASTTTDCGRRRVSSATWLARTALEHAAAACSSVPKNCMSALPTFGMKTQINGTKSHGFAWVHCYITDY
jgi:hypothetical protein